MSAAREIMTTLNSLNMGELGSVFRQLERASKALEELGQPELAADATASAQALRRGDVKEFRRGVASLTARLGHVR